MSLLLLLMNLVGTKSISFLKKILLTFEQLSF